MEIRVINKEKAIVNVSSLSIMAEGRYIVGKNERNDVIVVEKFGSEEEAEEVMEKVIWVIEKANEVDKESLILDFRDKEDRSEYKIEEKYDMPY